MDNTQRTLGVTEAELGWLAGIIDGEGTIVLFLSLKNGKLQTASPQIIIGNTEKVMIEKIADILGRLGIGVHISSREPKHPNGVTHTRKTKYKTLYVASVVGFLRAKKVLDVIVPYLVTSKREKGEAILRYINQRCERVFPDGVRGRRNQGTKVPFNASDIRLVLNIVSMGKTKHLSIVERLLRDLEQAERSKPRLFDDVVRPDIERV